MANYTNTLTLDVSNFLKSVKTAIGITDKISKGIDAKADIDVAVHDAQVDALKADVKALDGKNVNLDIKVDDSQLKSATASAAKSGGIMGGVIGGAIGSAGIGLAISGIKSLGGALTEGALAGDDLGDSLEVAYAQKGIKDLEGAIASTTKANLDLANSLGQPVERIDELSIAAAGLAGASGQANTDLVKLATAAETSTGGLVKGEALIKAFSRGMADPEGAAAIEGLTKKFPQLTDVLKGSGTAAEKAQAALAAMGPTLATLESQAQGPDAVLQRLKNTLSRSFQEAGASVFEAITPITKVLGEILPPLLQSLGPALGGIIASVAPLLASLATQLGPVISTIADNLVPVIGSLVSGLLPVVSAVLPAFVTILQAVGPVIGKVAGVVGVLLAALASGLAPILEVVAQVLGDVVTALGPLIDALGDILPPILQAILKPVGDLLKAFLPIIPVIVDVLVPIITTLARILGVVLVGAVNILTVPLKIMTSIIEFVVGIVEKGVTFFKGLFDTFVKGVSSVSFLSDAFTYIGTALQNLIGSLPDWIKDILGLNDANTTLAEGTDAATASTRELTAEQKKALAAEQANADAAKKTGAAKTGAAKTLLQKRQEELAAAIKLRSIELDELARANRRKVLAGEITQDEATRLEALKKQEIAQKNILATTEKLGLVVGANGTVTTTLKLNADEIKSFDAGEVLRNVRNQFDDAEVAVIKIDKDATTKEINETVADALESANILVGAKFFEFDDAIIARFVKQGVDGIEKFNESVQSKIGDVDANIAALRTLAESQDVAGRTKTLADIQKLESQRVTIVTNAALAEKKIRDGVTASLNEQTGFLQTLAGVLANFSIEFDTKQSDEALEATKEKLDDLNTSFKDGEITYQSALDSLKDVGEEQADFFDALASSIATSGAAMSDALEEAGIKAITSGETIGDTAGILAASVGASFASMAASGENVWTAIAKSAFDGLQALIPIISAQILGLSLSGPDSVLTGGTVGLARWAALTAVINIAVAGARAAAGFKGGGYTGDGAPDGVAGPVHFREWVADENLTARYRKLFEHLDANRPLSEYPEIQAMLSANGIGSADATPQGIFNIQPVTYIPSQAATTDATNETLTNILEQLQGMQAVQKRAERVTLELDRALLDKESRHKKVRGMG